MPLRSAVPVVRLLSACLLTLALAACAAFFKHDPLNVPAGIQPLPGEGLELRMAVKLQVQNPNDMAPGLRRRSAGAGTQQPPAKAGGLVLRTERPDTRRLNDAF